MIPWRFTTSLFTTNTNHHETIHHSSLFNTEIFQHWVFSPLRTFHHGAQITIKNVHHGSNKHCRNFLIGSSECIKRMHSICTIININIPVWPSYLWHASSLLLPCAKISINPLLRPMNPLYDTPDWNRMMKVQILMLILLFYRML